MHFMRTMHVFGTKKSWNWNELLKHHYSKLENNIWYMASKDINHDGFILGFVIIGWLEHMLWPKHEICALYALSWERVNQQ